MKRALGLVLLVIPVATGGCLFGDDDPPPCFLGIGDSADLAFPSPGVRNPVTGQCEAQGGGGGNPCDGVPVAGDTPGAPEFDPAFQDWAFCDQFCEGLDEQTCKATDGCRAAYVDPCSDLDCFAELQFIECWGTAPSGPARGGDCTTFDAYTCSIHDDCSPVHRGNQAPHGDFFHCIPEDECTIIDGEAFLRNPETGTCDTFGINGCVGVPEPVPFPDWASCGSECEALDEASCLATSGCRGIYVDACPACDALVLEFAACWGIAPSGPAQGDCALLDSYECSRHDDCVAVHANDWDQCADPTFPCDWSPLGFQWCKGESSEPPPPPMP